MQDDQNLTGHKKVSPRRILEDFEYIILFTFDQTKISFLQIFSRLNPISTVLLYFLVGTSELTECEFIVLINTETILNSYLYYIYVYLCYVVITVTTLSCSSSSSN